VTTNKGYKYWGRSARRVRRAASVAVGVAAVLLPAGASQAQLNAPWVWLHESFDPNGPADNGGLIKLIGTGLPAVQLPGPPAGGVVLTKLDVPNDVELIAGTFDPNGANDDPSQPSGPAGDPTEGGAPENNVCLAGTLIPGNALSFNPPLLDTTGATADQCTFHGCGGNANSVWYEFTPDCDGSISLNTNGSNYDTGLVIFPDDCSYLDPMTGCHTPDELICDDDSGTGNASQISNFAVAAGTTYRISISSSPSGGGMLDFNFMFTPPAPANDTCATAQVIPGATQSAVSFTVSDLCTLGANADPADPQESCESGGVGVSNSVWYRFTPAYDGIANINTGGSDYDTVLAVFSGGCAAPIQVACGDDFLFTQTSVVSAPMTANTPYWIKVSDYGLPGGGLMDLNFSFAAAPPSNDSCGTPTIIPSDTTVYNPSPINTSGADVIFQEPNDPCEAGGEGVSNSVFYGFVPPCDGEISVNTNGSSYDTVLSVWHSHCGTAIGQNVYQNPPFVACDDDGGRGLASQLVNVPVQGGIYYIIKVSDYNPAPGGGLLDFNFQYTASGLGIVFATDPPKDNPWLPGQQAFRDVLQNRDATGSVDQGIGAAGTPPAGSVHYDAVTVVFSQQQCDLTMSGVMIECTDSVGNGQADCPAVTNVTGSGLGPYTITLSGPIPVRECTTFTFTGTNAGQKLQYQSLPGDVSMNGVANTQDLLTLVQALNNGDANVAQNIARYNINRSTGTNPVNTQDLLRLVQLLNGTNTTQSFNGASVAACP